MAELEEPRGQGEKDRAMCRYRSPGLCLGAAWKLESRRVNIADLFLGPFLLAIGGMKGKSGRNNAPSWISCPRD